jgi:uroporphyrinogen decarboxylase
VGDAIRAICRDVGLDVPVIGFAAAPWTLACYMIEGQTRGDISTAKRVMHDEPELLRDLLGRIAGATVGYLKSQIAAGAAVVQLFDTWAGELTREEYEAFELPATRTVFESLGAAHVPKILYGKGSSHLIEPQSNTGADVLSVDWRTDLVEARCALGKRVALQGNVDPNVLLGTEDAIREAAREAVEKTGGVGHILNLGHGILPGTPVENARAFVEAGHMAPIPARVRSGEAD